MAEEPKESMSPENSLSVITQAPKPEGRTFLDRLENLLARLKPGVTPQTERLAETQAKMRQESASKTPTPTGKSA